MCPKRRSNTDVRVGESIDMRIELASADDAEEILALIRAKIWGNLSEERLSPNSFQRLQSFLSLWGNSLDL